MTDRWLTLTFIHLVILLSFDLQAQSIKHKLDSLHKLVVSEKSRYANEKILQQVKYLLEQAKSSQQRDRVADAYLVLAKINFNLKIRRCPCRLQPLVRWS